MISIFLNHQFFGMACFFKQFPGMGHRYNRVVFPMKDQEIADGRQAVRQIEPKPGRKCQIRRKPCRDNTLGRNNQRAAVKRCGNGNQCMDACCGCYRNTNRPSQAAAEKSCHRTKAVKVSQKVNSADKVPATSSKISGIGLAAITMAASAMIEPEKSHSVFAALPGQFNLFG